MAPAAAEISNSAARGAGKLPLLLFLLLWASFAYFHHTGQHNENARYDQLRALTEHGEWNIDRFAGNTADVITVDGKVFPNKTPGTTFLGLLPWIASRALLSLTSMTEAAQLHFAGYFVTISTLGVFSALTGCALLLYLHRIGASARAALAFALLYSLGTIAFPFSTVFFSHQLAASFLFLGFYLLSKHRIADTPEGALGRKEMIELAVAGVLLGFAPVLEYPAALGTVLIGLYGLVSLRWRQFALFVAGGVVGGSFLLFYNWVAFDRIFFITYEAYKGPNAAFLANSTGIGGVSWPRLDVLWELTFARQRGLFYVNPWLAMIIPAVFTFWRFRERRRELTLCFALVIAFFLFNSGFGDSIVYWGGAWSVGPRHVVPMLPFMAIPIALLCRVRTFALIASIMGVVSVFAMFLAAAIAPRVPYEAQDPFLHFYLRQFFLGRFSLNESAILAQQLVPGFSFNVARLIGVPARAELVPIALLWALAIPWLFRMAWSTPVPSGPRWPAKVVPLGFSAAIVVFSMLPVVWNPYAFDRAGWSHGLSAAMVPGRFAENVSSADADSTFLPHPQIIHRLDPLIDFSWRDANEPLRAPFAAVWTGDLYVPVDGIYSFVIESDDGAAFYLDGSLVVDRWRVQFPQRSVAAVQLSRGFHPVVLQYENVLFSGTMRFFWTPPRMPLEIVPSEFLFSR